MKKDFIFALFQKGTLAQLVEQRTENPCVPGSIPGGTTNPSLTRGVFLCLKKCIYTLFLTTSSVAVPLIETNDASDHEANLF